MAALVGYSLPNARAADIVKYASLALKSYDESKYELVSGDSCWYEVISNKNNTELPLLEISFKGSNSAEQWLLNTISPSALFAGRSTSDASSIETTVNTALIRALVDNIRDGIYAEKLASESANKDADSFDFFSSYEFVLCGHSRGGLLATTAALYLLEKGAHVRAIYTYGSPKLYSGYNIHAPQLMALRALLISVIHKGDPVPCALDAVARRYGLGDGTMGDVSIKLQNVAGRAPSSGQKPSFFSALASAAADAVLGCHSMKYCYLPGCEQMHLEFIERYDDDQVVYGREVTSAVVLDTNPDNRSNGDNTNMSSSRTGSNQRNAEVPMVAAALIEDVDGDAQRHAGKVLSGKVLNDCTPSAPLLSAPSSRPSAPCMTQHDGSADAQYATATPVSDTPQQSNAPTPIAVEGTALSDDVEKKSNHSENILSEGLQYAFRNLITKSPSTSTKSAPLSDGTSPSVKGDTSSKNSGSLRGNPAPAIRNGNASDSGSGVTNSNTNTETSTSGMTTVAAVAAAAGAAYSLYAAYANANNNSSQVPGSDSYREKSSASSKSVGK